MKHSIFAVLVITSISVAQDTTRPILMAHFMPWYQTPAVHGYWGWHWTMNYFRPDLIDGSGRRQIASQYYPLTGPYDSNDEQILEYQTLLMKISGIDGVLVDWYGTDGFVDYPVLNESTNLIFAAIQRAHLSFGIVYEDQTIKHEIDYGYLSVADAFDHGKAAMTYLQQHWFGTSTYLKIDNRPVLLNFGPQYFTQSSDWDTLFSVLPVTPSFFTIVNRLSPIASGAYPWPPMYDHDASGTLSQTALNNFLDWFYGQAAAWPHTIASAFPGFYDIYQQAGVSPSLGYLDPLNGFTFRSTLQQALNHRPDVIQLVTWNDYGEGTIIEPTVQFGYQYLEIVQAIKDSLNPAFPFRKEDLELPFRLHQARQQFAGNSAVKSILDSVFTLIISEQRDAAIALMDSLAVTSAGSPGVGGPFKYSLGQNFPNPFNPTTTIKFSVPARSRVRLTIFNLLGQQVAELANEEMNAGNFERVWNANVASGLYFYRLEAISVSDPSKRFVDVKKMVLLK